MGKHALPSQPRSRRALRGILAASLLFSAGLAGATVSAFTDAATTDISVTAGSIDLRVNVGGSDSKSAILAAETNFGPGDQFNRSFTLKNLGTLPLTLSMTASRTTGSQDFMEHLDAVVIIDGVDVFDGSLADAAFFNVIIPAGGNVSVEVAVLWRDSPQDNEFAGANVITRLNFLAESLPDDYPIDS